MRLVALGFLVTALLAGGTEAQGKDDWRSGGSGHGTARWKGTERQLVDRGGPDFGWAVSGPPIQDGSVQVRFRLVEGQNDQAGGVVWRWQNKDNYYIARANALENAGRGRLPVDRTRRDCCR